MIDQIIKEYLEKYPFDSFAEIGRKIYQSGKTKFAEKTLKDKVIDYCKLNKIKIRVPQKKTNNKETIKKLLQTPTTIAAISEKINLKQPEIKKIIKDLSQEGFNITKYGNKFELSTIINQGGEHIINLSKFENKPYRFGIVSDNHLNSKYERLDVLNALYDYFEEQGITEVFNAGNWVDGECRFNKYEIINHGISPQIKYFVEKYPQRKGITTYFIAGDDHEGWWVQRERIDIGRYAQMVAEEAGRNDLKYLGYMEYDVILKQKQGQAIMRIMHPGGGSAYALSYSPQKTVEAFQGGEKPQILILGHYHKADYMYYRDVHILQAGCTQDQSLFLRKQKIQVALGGWIIEFSQSKDGAINRFKSEWIPFLDKQYYHRNGYYR